jgi:hypothetical protein
MAFKPKKVLMPSDYLSKADRRIYERSSPMLVYYKEGTKNNMQENLISLLNMSPKEAQETLKFKVHDVSDVIIAEEFGIELAVMRRFRQMLELQKDRLGKVIRVGDDPKWPPTFRIDLDRKQKVASDEQTPVQRIAKVKPIVQVAPVVAAPVVPPKGFYMRVNGEYSMKNLSFYFEGVTAMLNANPENEGRNFNITFELSESQQ